MKVVTWNCNLKFAVKYKLIEPLDADILIIQECEELPTNFLPGYQLFWTGNNTSKGLAVIIRGDSAFIDKGFSKDFIYFLPIHSKYGLVLGVWSFNHRAKKFGLKSNGFLTDTLDFYHNILSSASSAIISGDFNNNPQWDRLSFYKNNFQHISNELEQRGFESSYHKSRGEPHGDESAHTFFHQRNVDKKFHIDYIFSKGLAQIRCKVGSYGDWSEYSDHVPVIAEFSNP